MDKKSPNMVEKIKAWMALQGIMQPSPTPTQSGSTWDALAAQNPQPVNPVAKSLKKAFE